MGARLRSTVSIVTQTGTQSWEHVFDRSPVIVSRTDPSRHAGPRVLPVPLRFMSTKHAEIHFDETGIRWQDTNSANGILLGDRNLRGAGPVPIPDDATLTLEGDGSELRITLRLAPDAAATHTAVTLIDELAPIVPQPALADTIDPTVQRIARLVRLNCQTLQRLCDLHRKRKPLLGFTSLVSDSALYGEKLREASLTEDWMLDETEPKVFEAIERAYWDLTMDCAVMPDASIRAARSLMRERTFAGRLADRLSKVPLLGWAGALVRRFFCLTDNEVESEFLTRLRRSYDEQRALRPYQPGAASARGPATHFGRVR
jgi:hypothetical protein